MGANDYKRWFVTEDGTVIQCPIDSFKQYCKKLFGEDWYTKYRMFRKATFEEHCIFENDLMY